MGRLGLAVLALCCAAGGAQAREAADLELVLAVDLSRSVDAYEFDLQREGYAAAITHPDVLKAIRSGILGAIAVTLVHWSGPLQQTSAVPWMVVRDAASANAVAAAIRAAPRSFFGGTSISGAIDYAADLFEQNDIDGTRRVIDVSGDGINSHGRSVTAARDEAVARGLTINGLAIVNDRPSRPPWPEPAIDEYYRDNVIGGPGAFMIAVRGFEAFAEGIRKKLILEISALPGPDR